MPTSITGQGISVYPAPDDALSSTSKNPVQNKVIDEEFSDFNRQLSDLQPAATSADVGKALIVKTVDAQTGKPSSYEYGEAGGGGSSEDMDLLIREVDEVVTPNYVKNSKYAINRDGSISVVTTNDNLFTFSVDGIDNVLFKVAQRVSGTNNYAFYTATTFEGCDANTLIDTVKKYTNWADNIVAVPETAKMMLIQSNGNVDHIQTERIYKESIAGVEVQELSDKIDATLGETTDFTSFCVFTRGRKGTGTSIVASNYYIISTLPFYVDRNIVWQVASGYNCTIYYFKSDGQDAGSTGGTTTLFSRTILAGSRIMVLISKSDSSEISRAEVKEIAKKVTFSTEYQDLKDTVNRLDDYSGLAAQMYQKGDSPKTFIPGIGVICAGQSQMDGRVPLADLPDDIHTTMTYAHYVAPSTGAISDISVTGTWNVVTSLWDSFDKAEINSYDIKKAVGDTSLYAYGSTRNWTPFYELIQRNNSLLLDLEDQIRIAMSVDSNIFNIRAFVWMQGEADRQSTSKEAALQYYRNLKCLVAYVRGIVGNERLPFICGTVSHLSSQYSQLVEEATIKVCAEDNNAVCIDMSGAPLLSDGVHLNADSAVYFGRMAFDALIDFGVITATKLNPTRPW